MPHITKFKKKKYIYIYIYKNKIKKLQGSQEKRETDKKLATKEEVIRYTYLFLP